jgi:hypothetical protein
VPPERITVQIVPITASRLKNMNQLNKNKINNKAIKNIIRMNLLGLFGLIFLSLINPYIAKAARASIITGEKNRIEYSSIPTIEGAHAFAINGATNPPKTPNFNNNFFIGLKIIFADL